MFLTYLPLSLFDPPRTTLHHRRRPPSPPAHSKVDKNVEVVVREGGVKTLTSVLQSASAARGAGSGAGGKMSAKEEEEQSNSMTSAAKARSVVIQSATRYKSNYLQMTIHFFFNSQQKHSSFGSCEIVSRQKSTIFLDNFDKICFPTAFFHTKICGNSALLPATLSLSQALGTLTKNERVARVLGRDHEAIKTVIASIAQARHRLAVHASSGYPGEKIANISKIIIVHFSPRSTSN